MSTNTRRRRRKPKQKEQLKQEKQQSSSTSNNRGRLKERKQQDQRKGDEQLPFPSSLLPIHQEYKSFSSNYYNFSSSEDESSYDVDGFMGWNHKRRSQRSLDEEEKEEKHSRQDFTKDDQYDAQDRISQQQQQQQQQKKQHVHHHDDLQPRQLGEMEKQDDENESIICNSAKSGRRDDNKASVDVNTASMTTGTRGKPKRDSKKHQKNKISYQHNDHIENMDTKRTKKNSIKNNSTSKKRNSQKLNHNNNNNNSCKTYHHRRSNHYYHHETNHHYHHRHYTENTIKEGIVMDQDHSDHDPHNHPLTKSELHNVDDGKNYDTRYKYDNHNHESNSLHSLSSSFDDNSDLNSSTSSEERWSLSVRINSAVDLPSSIIPTMPLCPSMKFGLITVTQDDEILDLEKSSAKFRRAVFEQEQVKDLNVNISGMDINSGVSGNSGGAATGGRKVTSGTATGAGSATATDNNIQNDGDVGSDVTESYQTQNSLKMYCFSGKTGALAKFQNNVSLEECITSATSEFQEETKTGETKPIPPKIQLTSGKILSKKDAGMMEWNEEMRWDDVELPLQTVLCIELSAKAVFPPSFLSDLNNIDDSNSTSSFSTMAADSWNNLKRNYSHGALSSISRDFDSSTGGNSNSGANGGNSAPSSGNGGLLGFWRKGRTRGRRGNNHNNINPIGAMTGAGSTLLNASSFHGDDKGADEMETAAAAAAVARYIMDQEDNSSDDTEGDQGDGNSSDDNSRNITKGTATDGSAGGQYSGKKRNK